MRHRKRLYSLAAGSIRRARASAPVGERNRANSSCIRAGAVSIRIGIDDGEHVRMLSGNVGIVASATLDAPVHSMSASRRGSILDPLIRGCVDDYDVISRTHRRTIDVR